MTHLQLIGGEWLPAAGGGTWDLVDPATEEVIEQVPYGDAADMEAAIAAAAGALDAWAAMNPFQRGKVLEEAALLLGERAGEYARVTTEESGKPVSQSRAEWLSAPNYLLYAAEEAKRLGGRIVPPRSSGRRIDVTYQPMGVVGVVTAWNFPVYNPNRATASALAAGCTVVIRPSEYTPRTAMLYGRALTDAGVPAGVVNVVNGEPHPMGQALLDDPRVRKIAFTGSVRVGKLLMDGASRTVTRLSLELGGNAPVLVFPDVDDVEAVAAGGVAARNRNAGQVCIAPQRFLVHSRIADRFTKAAAEATERETMGPGLEPGTTVGPLINRSQLERVERIVGDTLEAGGRLVIGGETPTGRGYFYAPTVVGETPPGSALAVEEVFGPVLSVTPFDTTDEALAMANATEYGLASFVWTADLRTALSVSERLEYGLVGINDWYPVTPEAPFGGMKQSGVGRESGHEGLHEYLEVKTRFFGGLG